MTGEDIFISLASYHEPGLVVLSVVVAIASSYVALDLAGRIAASRGSDRALWLAGGAFSLGLGVWAMHFIGMLAFRLPVPVAYEPFTVVASLLAAVLGAAVALQVAAGERVGAASLLGGAVVMGSGIGAMHYGGMMAMRLPARILYDPFVFGLSVAIAVTVSAVAMWLAFALRGQSGGIGTLQRTVAALVMGASIAGLHYTAMAAAHFVPTGTAHAAGETQGTPVGLALGVGLSTAVVLGIAVAASLTAKRPARAPQAAR
jgi:NO-binding membrane sensor protein with MHYT domain